MKIWLSTLLLMMVLSIGAPLQAFQDDETVTYTYEVSGSTADWLRTDIKLELGDIFSISASGTINIWPNCEDTKADEGFPDLDCTLVQQIGPNGTTAFNPAEEDYPFPGALVAALVGQVGDGQPFLIGTGGTFTADDKGRLKLAFNDSRLLGDNSGAFIAEITVPNPDELCGPVNDWVDFGFEVEAGQSFSVDASGTINIWPACTEPNEFGVTCDAMLVSPNGTTAFDPGVEGYPLPGAPISALVGRINDGDTFLIGEHGAFVAETDGSLYLRTNDVPEYTQDDEGCFAVAISEPMFSPAVDNTVITLTGTTQDWWASDVIVSPGEVISISARGSIHVKTPCEDCESFWADVVGTRESRLADDAYPMPLARVGALIAKVGDGEPFFVGSGGQFKVTTEGILQFRLNTVGDMSNNTGEMVIFIEKGS
jgi:hypothetical protein